MTSRPNQPHGNACENAFSRVPAGTGGHRAASRRSRTNRPRKFSGGKLAKIVLSIVERAPFRIGAFELSDNGIEVHGRPSLSEYQGCLDFVDRTHKASGWWLVSTPSEILRHAYPYPAHAGRNLWYPPVAWCSARAGR